MNSLRKRFKQGGSENIEDKKLFEVSSALVIQNLMIISPRERKYKVKGD